MFRENEVVHEKKRDDIDNELSRAYFGRVYPERTSRGDRSPSEGKKSGARILILIMLVLLSAIVIASYVAIRNNVSFTVNIDLAGTDQKTPVDATETVAGSKDLSVERSLVLSDFEKDDNNWEIPSWAMEKDDHVARDLYRCNEIASNGSGSLAFFANMPARKWSGALVEVQQYTDLAGYDMLCTDIYIPPDAPAGLKAKMILTIGEEWRFVEMAWGKKLFSGKWNTIEADISDTSRDWKRTTPDSSFRSDIRKISIRVESDKNPAWSGKINIDNIRALSAE